MQEQIERTRSQSHGLSLALEPALGFPEGERSEAQANVATCERCAVGQRKVGRWFLGACLHGARSANRAERRSNRGRVHPVRGGCTGGGSGRASSWRRTAVRGDAARHIGARKATRRVRCNAYRSRAAMPTL